MAFSSRFLGWRANRPYISLSRVKDLFLSHPSRNSRIEMYDSNNNDFPLPSHVPITSPQFYKLVLHRFFTLPRCLPDRHKSNALVNLNTDNEVARFSLHEPKSKLKPVNRENLKETPKPKKKKMSRKQKVNELKWFRLKAKRKMKSPNPEVRIRYKLEKAKRKEVWLIEKLRKYDLPKLPEQTHDPEILTEEEKFYLRRTGEKKKNYVQVGRRGVFGGVVLNMHLHWKNHETVKVVCRACKPGQVHEYADELARLSKGTVIGIMSNNIIIFYRGKNYVRPDDMSPLTLSKQKALEKYRYRQSLEHTSKFIEKLEKELEEYKKHVALFKKHKGSIPNEETIDEKIAVDKSENHRVS